ncbi:MAG: LanC-like protein [Myxococcota bacterium]
MSELDPRYVGNDVLPVDEELAAEDAEAIRQRCAGALAEGLSRLVEAAPPRAARRARFAGGPTLYVGLLGQAFGFLHLFERTREPGHLDLAAEYLRAASAALDASSFPRPEEWLSFHGTGGLPAIAAVIHHRRGDAAECARQLEDYRRLAQRAAAPDFPSEDLLWGRGGFLFGAAFLRSSLGADVLSDTCIAGALEAMLETGRRHARAHAPHLVRGPHGRPPLVYLNLNGFVMTCFARAYIPGRSRVSRALAFLAGHAIVLAGARTYGLLHRYDLGLVHGTPGNLYLMMHFPDLLRACGGWDDVRATLDCVADSVDRERGVRELLPSPYTETLHARTKTPEYTDRVHWCSGSPAAVFVFSRAFEVFGDEAYLGVAQRAAEHVWRYGLLRKGNGICHGIAGNGYAFLALYRATGCRRDLDRALHFARHTWSERVIRQQRTPDRPWSLYEGALGTLCFYQDCLDPKRARFPGFEVQ